MIESLLLVKIAEAALANIKGFEARWSFICRTMSGRILYADESPFFSGIAHHDGKTLLVLRFHPRASVMLSRNGNLHSHDENGSEYKGVICAEILEGSYIA